MLTTSVKVVVVFLFVWLLLSSQVVETVEHLVVTWAGKTLGTFLAHLICALPLAVGLGVLFSGSSDDGSNAKGDGRVILISGCDSGIGNLAAKTLHAKGYKVVAGCLTTKGAEDLERECPGVIGIKCDVTREEDVANIAAKVSSVNGGQLHAVINNAGVASGAEVLIQDNSDYENTLNVNLMGSIRFTKATLHMLIDTPGSRVVFMSSVAGLVPFPGMSEYTTSKFGIEGFAGVLRGEMECFDVQVTLLNPSAMITPILDSCNENYIKCHAKASPAAKKLYGEDYVQKVIESRQPEKLPPFLSFDTPDVAVMDICRAVGSKKPQTRCYSGKASKTLFRLGHMFPAFMRSMFRLSASANPPVGCVKK